MKMKFMKNKNQKKKSNKLQSELNRLKNNKENLNSKSFSQIYVSEWFGIPVTVIVIFDPKITEAFLDEFNNEREKLFILRHPYIIQLYGITDKDKSQKLAVIT